MGRVEALFDLFKKKKKKRNRLETLFNKGESTTWHKRALPEAIIT